MEKENFSQWPFKGCFMFRFSLIFLLFCQAAYTGTSDQRVTNKILNKLELNAELKVIGSISRKESAKLKLEFFDTKSKLRKAIKLETIPAASLWMEMADGKGHGSEKLKIEIENTSYIISNAWFLMMGQWELKVKVTHNEKTQLLSLPICVGRKPADSHVGKCK